MLRDGCEGIVLYSWIIQDIRAGNHNIQYLLITIIDYKVLVVITFLLARVGYGGIYPTFGHSKDAEWLGYLTVGGWCIIIPAIIVGIILGHPMHWTMVRLLIS